MKISLPILIGIYKLIFIDGRLILKNTDTTQIANKSDDIKPTRLTRDIIYNKFSGLSKEEDSVSSKLATIQRVIRDSSTNTKIQANTNLNNSNTELEVTKNKSILIKKPIPKFNDVEYEDEFQMRINKASLKTTDSVEHEDEDFNVDDYEFDINHDEFTGRGKPLEPRTKIKYSKTQHEQAPKIHSEINTKPPTKQTEKVNLPIIQLKKKRDNIAKADEKTIVDDCYHDISSTISLKAKIIDDKVIDNHEKMDSKENYRESGRTIRSSWNNRYVDKFIDNSSKKVNILSILPLFPQIVPKIDEITII